MIEIARERELPSPPEELWPLVSDPSRLGDWFAFADSAEAIGGEPGVGQRRRMYGHWGKRRSEIDQRVTDWDPPRRIGWEHEAERLDGKPAPRFAAETLFTIELDPAGAGGSRVRLTSRQRPASRPRGIVIRLFGGREIGGKLVESLERLDQVTSRSLPDSTS